MHLEINQSDIVEALHIMQQYANYVAAEHRDLIGKQPTREGWSQEKHDATHANAMDAALKVYTFCQAHLFKLD